MKQLLQCILVLFAIQSNAQVNNPPSAVDDFYNTGIGIQIVLTPLLNDFDPDGQTLTIVSIGPATNGTIINQSSTITYIPNAGFIGIETLMYTITDGVGATDFGQIIIYVAGSVIIHNDGSISLQNHTTQPSSTTNKFYVVNNEPYYDGKNINSQLEKITQGGNTGWRPLGRNPANYGNIGDGAFDFSESYTTGNFFRGATGQNSVAFGNTVSSLGYNTSVFGYGNRASAIHSFAIGRFCDSISGSSREFWVETDPLFIVGNGSDVFNTKNAVTVYKNGNTDLNGYVRLGKVDDSAPKIKMKELPITNTNSNYNGNIPIPHELTSSKILSVNILVEWDISNGGNYAPPEYEANSNLKYSYFISGPNIVIQNNCPSANGCLINNKPTKVLITYKE